MQSNHSSNTVLIGCCKQREIVIVCNWYIIELNLLRHFTKVSQQQLDLRLLVAAAWSGQPFGHDSCLVKAFQRPTAYHLAVIKGLQRMTTCSPYEFLPTHQ